MTFLGIVGLRFIAPAWLWFRGLAGPAAIGRAGVGEKLEGALRQRMAGAGLQKSLGRQAKL
jgi:hypothetical protein